MNFNEIPPWPDRQLSDDSAELTDDDDEFDDYTHIQNLLDQVEHLSVSRQPTPPTTSDSPLFIPNVSNEDLEAMDTEEIVPVPAPRVFHFVPQPVTPSAKSLSTNKSHTYESSPRAANAPHTQIEPPACWKSDSDDQPGPMVGWNLLKALRPAKQYELGASDEQAAAVLCENLTGLVGEIHRSTDLEDLRHSVREQIAERKRERGGRKPGAEWADEDDLAIEWNQLSISDKRAPRPTGVANTKLSDIKFPEQFAFLLELSKLDQHTIESHPKCGELRRIMNSDNQESMAQLIEKQLAIVCLYWVQGLLEARQPVFLGASLAYKEHKVFRYQVRGVEKRTTVVFFKLALPREKRQPNFRPSNARLTQLSVLLEGQPLFSGFVVRRADDMLILKTDRVDEAVLDALKKVEEANEGLEVDLYERPNEFVPTSMVRSVRGVQSGQLDALLMPKPELKAHSKYEKELASAFKQYKKIDKISKLNMEQQSVVYNFANDVHNPYPFILYGPPGTGKTETIGATVWFLCRTQPASRVLVCTPSNMAANRVAEKLLDYADQTHLPTERVLRMNSCAIDYEHRDPKLDPIVCANKALRRFEIPPIDELTTYKVVVCTLACSSHLISRGVPKGHFTHIIIDEAGQASEAETWIPLGGLANQRTSVMLCGDPKQLGPVVTLALPKFWTDKFVSPLCRFMANPCYTSDQRLCVQLRECYRCHPAIVTVASRLFYDNTLVVAKGAEPKNQLAGWSFLPNSGFPLMFVDAAKGVEKREPGGSSYGNDAELAYIIEAVVALMTHLRVAAKDIGIISPYRYQSRLILECLKKHEDLARHVDDLTVDSVERFQGSERRVIFMTCTRTQGLGFVGCKLRLNTSITRAQQLLIVVGNAQALSRHREWRMFIMYCTENQAYKRIDS